jgi:FdhD protein
VTDSATIDVVVERMHADRQAAEIQDVLAVEEPLEIRLVVDGASAQRTISVTMRTPGDDVDLVAGFLFTERVVLDHRDVVRIERDADNVLTARVSANVDLTRLERHSYVSSSCGVCGKASLDALRTVSRYPLAPGEPLVDASSIHRLPDALRAAQATFERTGGLHAAGLFDTDGRLRCLREDVGRHNALDKTIGAEFLAGRLPADRAVLAVSGRVGFELVQKAAMAGIPILVAVGAPSSLALQLATCVGMTLIGFARDGRFNVYAGGERVRA